MYGSVIIFGKAKAEVGIVPFQSGTLTYNGSEQSPVWNGFNSDAVEISGTTSAVNAGTYTAIFTPKEGYVWSDGSMDAKSITWTIKRASLTVPSQKGSLTYTGSEQTPTWNNYDSSKMTISGTTKGTNAGSYTATFTQNANYQWSDGTTGAKSVTWSIGKASLNVPSQSGSLTYTGSEQTPAWNNYDSSKMTIAGTTKGTNVGSYIVAFALNSNCQWSDGTTGAKSVAWTIGKAAGSLSLDKSSMSLDVSNLTGTIEVTREGDGAITATSSSTKVATVSVSGNIVTVTAKDSGSATITIKVAAGTNHTAPANQTCSVTAELPSKTLSDNTPETIQAAAKAGVAPNFWKVGDKIGIEINGSFGGLSYNGTVYAFILGFNHNSGVEGSNSIHFQFGKTSDSTNIAFYQGSNKGGVGFCMYKTQTNIGGWNNSYMRETICPAFLSALPTAWQNVIAACTKYSDNAGGDEDIASHVTATSDKIWLLTEIEVFGARWYSNSAEANYTKQYDYYKNGNGRVKYRHDKTTEACAWWLRSVDVLYGIGFSCATSGGERNTYRADASISFAPCFMVA